ncbi:fanconi-associated nuclease 1 isoform X2 [Anoplophora glabripennis]|uniref:fanconi-associated nuclease 1 isoform X2 n=1 Tax=Anoplophora glabripennis TaxID=217634 RepID=UPI0008758715|nr:fanconi-associated nuclease 1 isoform X2 [Anoplophora glabripennis]
MSKSKTSKKITKCNLKQTDIFTAFQNWKSIKKERDMKKIALSAEIIVISDSDSESEIERTSCTNSFPKKKRPLAQPFSDDEEEQGFSNETIPIESGDSPMYPAACSTPRPVSNLGDDLDTHVGREILDISQIEKSGCSPATSTDSEKTVVEKEVSHTGRVQIINAVIIKPNNSSFYTNTTVQAQYSSNTESTGSPSGSCSRNTTVIPQCSSSTTSIAGTSKKRSIQQEKDAKKLRTMNTDAASTSEKFQQNMVSQEFRKNGSTSTSTCKCDSRWLSKENKPDCNKNKRKSDCPRLGEIKKCVVADKKGVKALGKDSVQKNQNKNTQQQVDNTLKVSSKENVHNYSKGGSTTDKNENLLLTVNKAIDSDRSGANISPNQNCSCREISPETVSKCDKTANSNGSPKKSLDNTSSSPGKNIVPKKEEKKMNTESLILLTGLFKTVFSSKHVVNNLLETERKLIKNFLLMDIKFQYVCLKLFTRQRKWYNAFKFCRLINLDMEETEVCEMVKIFEQHQIVDTTYMDESVQYLLQHLDNIDLRGICDKFRLKKTLSTKEEMVRYLLKYSKTQSTLTIQKSTNQLLLEEIERRMGRCIRLSEAFHNAFYSTYALGTFVNGMFLNITDYFSIILWKKAEFPDYPIDEYVIFSSRNDFVSYIKARKYRDELEKCTDHLLSLQLCKTIFGELKTLEDDRSDVERFENAPHLIRYTAKAVYVSTLSFMAERLYSKFPSDVKVWLEYMINKVNCPHKIGHWYCLLIWLYMKYLKPFNYDHAAQLLIEVLGEKREHLSEVQLYQLRKRGEQLNCTIKYKILLMNHDLIAELLPKRIRVEMFPENPVNAKAIRSNVSGKKRNYEVRDAEGNKIIYKVEDIALNDYLERLRYTGGVHCEGSIIKATFTLFFFDIIYSAKNSIPGTFVSKIQCEPLDMNTRYFYPNRKVEIDKRLREIESEWSDAKIIKFLKDNYEKHSHEFAVCEIGVIISDVKFLQDLVDCIGRKVLAKIYERLVKNFREYRSGLPDLLVWNVDRKECKFVEVKGENDKLSVNQTLWLDYLRKIGANIEVCHVHSIGSKRKLKKVVKNLEEASTSSS